MKPTPLILFFLFLLVHHTALAGPEHPQRIVSLGPINTENVFLLGAGDRLVANTSYCVRPEAAKEKEKVGSVMQVSIEKIIALQPDLVLATGLTSAQQVKQLQSIGIEVVQFSQPQSFTDICAQFLRLGQLLGLETEAKQIVREAKEQVAAIQEKVTPLPKPRVFLQIGAQPLFTAVPGSFTHDFIELGGGINISHELTFGTTSYEKVIAENPDVIIIAIMGTESGIAVREKEKWQEISAIKAVMNKRIHLINPDLACSPSPATFSEALTIVASLIHPGLKLDTLP